MKLTELKGIIENIPVTNDCKETYVELYDTMIDYWSELDDWFDNLPFNERCEDLLDNFITMDCGLFKLNDFGQPEKASIGDLTNLKEELLTCINEEIKRSK